MDSDEALGICLKVGTGAASYEEALQFLVERAVRLSTGQGRILPKKPEKTPVRIVSITKPEYIVAAPHALESVTLNPKKRGTKRLLAMHRAAGKVIIPYRYSAYYDGEQLTLAEGDDLPDRLCECLHEKRHSSWREGGLHGTRLNLNFYGENRNMGDRVSDAGLMEEAACDAMAHYDMLVLSHLTKEPELRKLLRNEVKQHKRVTTEQRRLIEERFTARVREELGLTDQQASRMTEVVGAYFVKRRVMEQEERRLRQGLAGELRPGVAADRENVGRLTDQLLDLKIRYVQSYKDEVRELSAFLDPVQRAQFLIMRERLLDRIQQAQEARADTAGPPFRRRLRQP